MSWGDLDRGRGCEQGAMAWGGSQGYFDAPCAIAAVRALRTPPLQSTRRTNHQLFITRVVVNEFFIQTSRTKREAL
jgi:hypothetical protein